MKYYQVLKNSDNLTFLEYKFLQKHGIFHFDQFLIYIYFYGILQQMKLLFLEISTGVLLEYLWLHSYIGYIVT